MSYKTVTIITTLGQLKSSFRRMPLNLKDRYGFLRTEEGEDMSSFENEQTDNFQRQWPHGYLAGENEFLRSAGFKQEQDGLWKKNGVYYGKEAAFQQAWRALREGSSACLY
jgi:hypothetical protein